MLRSSLITAGYLLMAAALCVSQEPPVTLIESDSIRDSNDTWTLIAEVAEPNNGFAYSGTIQAGGTAWSPALPYDPNVMNLISVYGYTDVLTILNDFGSSDSSVRTTNFSFEAVLDPNDADEDSGPTIDLQISSVVFSVEGVGVWTPAEFVGVLVGSGLFTVEQAAFWVNCYVTGDCSQLTTEDTEKGDEAAGGQVKVTLEFEGKLQIKFLTFGSIEGTAKVKIEGTSEAIRREVQAWSNMILDVIKRIGQQFSDWWNGPGNG